MKTIIPIIIGVAVLGFHMSGWANSKTHSSIQPAPIVGSGFKAPKFVPHAISSEDFKTAWVGMDYSSLIDIYGQPAHKQVYNSAGYKTLTVYYNDVNDNPDYPTESYQFSFENGSLASKAKY